MKLRLYLDGSAGTLASLHFFFAAASSHISCFIASSGCKHPVIKPLQAVCTHSCRGVMNKGVMLAVTDGRCLVLFVALFLCVLCRKVCF